MRKSTLFVLLAVGAVLLMSAQVNSPVAENPFTTIKAHYAPAFGETLYIRGNAPPLNWDRGIQMSYDQQSGSWFFETKEYGSGQVFEFKVLKNDEKPDTTGSHVGSGRSVAEVYPQF